MLCPIGEIYEIFSGRACLSVGLGDLVGLIEDRGGSNLHDDRISPWLHGVVAQLLLLAVNQDGHDAALY